MNSVEFTAFWLTVGLYLVGTATALCGVVFKKERLVKQALIACVAAFASHLVAITARVVHTGHIPVASLYENVLTGGAVVMLFSLLTIARRRALAALLVFAAPLTLLMLGYAFLNQPRFTTMSVVLDNMWMFVHIFFAWLAYGSYTVAAAIAVLLLLAGRYEGRERPPIYRPLPELAVLDDLMFRSIIFGFVTHAVMVASGAIWARDLWGSYWNWDPVETWSLVSWLVYGLWIHLRLTVRWSRRRMAWLAIIALATILMAFWGTNLFGGQTAHSLDDLKLRVE